MTPLFGQSVDDCMMCHEDPELEAEDGRFVGVDAGLYQNSIHGGFDCTDCHVQRGDYEDVPHYDVYRKVNCAECHDGATASYHSSFHGKAHLSGKNNAPDCASCHGSAGNPHAIGHLDLRTAENACRICHANEALQYDGGVHQLAAKAGKASPGCVSCHPTHGAELPPSVGAVNRMCEECHPGSMEQVKMGVHKDAAEILAEVIACASCHDVHSTHKPHLDQGTLQACHTCHEDYKEEFRWSVHEKIIEEGRMNCLSCHRTHQLTDASESEQFGCGACHEEVEAQYRNSTHRLARLHGDKNAAECADCHSGHNVLPASDMASPVNRHHIPETCGKCHTDAAVITTDYVRLPISLPSYMESIHGQEWKSDHNTAVCTDCHGTHNLYDASNVSSPINKRNIAATCGQCHEEAMHEYNDSIHGRALALGIQDSPSCTDCHDEHLIYAITDTSASPARTSVGGLDCCIECHENPEMAARYGLPPEVVESYRDSYHGWATKRGGVLVAKCIDCHETHIIKSPLDPSSSIHKDNVVATCGKCHENSNAEFAASYNHILARNKMMVHDYVKIIYIILIAFVLGGMALHNLIIWIHELKQHHRKHKKKKAVVRMSGSERIQHFILLFTFIGLAVTGFALRFPDQWWAQLLAQFGLTEEIRRIVHRSLAVAMVAASLYHVVYILFTHRGRMVGMAMVPNFRDLKDALVNMTYYLGFRKERPKFSYFDYTQKAEYWALIWGTVLMTITGFVLWFPTLATSWLPAWVVRVCETVHFYEAILAVSAIIIWHWFFVIFLPREYPVNWAWLTGKMDYEEWEENHGREAEEGRIKPEVIEGEEGS